MTAIFARQSAWLELLQKVAEHPTLHIQKWSVEILKLCISHYEGSDMPTCISGTLLEDRSNMADDPSDTTNDSNGCHTESNACKWLTNRHRVLSSNLLFSCLSKTLKPSHHHYFYCYLFNNPILLEITPGSDGSPLSLLKKNLWEQQALLTALKSRLTWLRRHQKHTICIHLSASLSLLLLLQFPLIIFLHLRRSM